MVRHSGSVKRFAIKIPAIKAITTSCSHVLTDIKSFSISKFYTVYGSSTACNKGNGIDSSFPLRIKCCLGILIPSSNTCTCCISVHYAVLIGISKELVSISCVRHIKGEVLSICCRCLRCGNSISTVKNSRATCNAYSSSTCGSGAECSSSNIVGFSCGHVINDEEVLSIGCIIVILSKSYHLGIIENTECIIISRCGNRNITGYERYEHKHLLILSVKSNVRASVNSSCSRTLNLYPFCIEGCVARYNSGKVIERACAVLIIIPTCKDIAISCRYGRIFKSCSRSYRLTCNYAFCSVKVEGYNTTCFFITVKPYIVSICSKFSINSLVSDLAASNGSYSSYIGVIGVPTAKCMTFQGCICEGGQICFNRIGENIAMGCSVCRYIGNGIFGSSPFCKQLYYTVAS